MLELIKTKNKLIKNKMENKFDFNTIQDFDNHIDKSIPSFSIMMKAIAEHVYNTILK